MTLKTGVMLKFCAAIQERHYILKHIINILYKMYFIIHNINVLNVIHPCSE